jgi:hypothetical protein
LGPGSVALDKLEIGRQLDIVGWHFDLDLRSVSFTERAIHKLKLVYGFFSVDVDRPDEFEVSAKVSFVDKPVFIYSPTSSAALHAETAGMVNTNVSKSIGKTAQNAIMVWRVMLCMLSFKPEKFARSFDSFWVVSMTVLLEYDASLMGFGLRLSQIGYLDKGHFEMTNYLGWGLTFSSLI